MHRRQLARSDALGHQAMGLIVRRGCIHHRGRGRRRRGAQTIEVLRPRDDAGPDGRSVQGLFDDLDRKGVGTRTPREGM